MGSACLFFHLAPSTALLGDVNPELIATFRAVQLHPRAVSNALERIPLGKRSYLKLRRADPNTFPENERAARFIFLNRFCFNGLYRTNGSGQFNVPYSASRNGHLPTSAELLSVSKRLSKVELVLSDFSKTLDQTEKGDFVYLDPPYAVSNRRIFRQYGPDSFGLDDLQRMQRDLLSLNKRGISFVVSYAYCSEALEIFTGWQITKTLTQRNISGFAKHRRRAAELLISNCI